MYLFVSTKIRDDGEMPPTPINLAYEGFFACVTIYVRSQGARTCEALFTDRTNMLLVATVCVLCTESIHHGCLIRVAVGTKYGLHHDPVVTVGGDASMYSECAMFIQVIAILVDGTIAGQEWHALPSRSCRYIPEVIQC